MPLFFASLVPLSFLSLVPLFCWYRHFSCKLPYKMVFSRVVFLTSLVPLFSWRRVLTCKFAYKVALLRVLFLMSFVRLCSGIGILPVNCRIKVALVCLHVDCVALPLRDPYINPKGVVALLTSIATRYKP